MNALAVAIGGALGALARYQAGLMFPHTQGGFPWATLLINIAGSFLFAFIYRYADGLTASATAKAFIGIGFCGAFTTFSTFSFEAVKLLQDGHAARAALYVAGSVALCLAGALAGLAAGSAMQ